MANMLIPVLTAMYLGGSFDMRSYKKGTADIFDHDTLEGNIQIIDRSFTKSQYKLVETSTQAREFLDVSGELSLRIKSGDTDIGGRGGYLKEDENRQRFVELLVRVQHETETETIPSHIKPTTEWMTKDPKYVGSHYVRSITYGGELIASLRLKAENSEQREKIKAAVSANLQMTGTFDLNANGSFDKLREDLKGMFNVEISVYATIPPRSPPSTIQQLMEVVEEYPKLVNSIGVRGRGTALMAELFPLSSLKADFPKYMSNNAMINLLDDIEAKYGDIEATRKDYEYWEKNRDNDKDTEEDDEKLNDFVESLENGRKFFRLAISEMDTSSAGKPDQFEKALEAYGSGKNNIPYRYQRWLSRLRHEIANETIVWKKLTGSGAAYINWGSSKCPQASASEMLYSGYASSSPNRAWGGGRDFLCLPGENLKLETGSEIPKEHGVLEKVTYRKLLEQEKTGLVKCASCLARNKITAQTIVAVDACPDGWDLEYEGYLMSDSFSHVDRDFMCLNKNVEDVEDFVSNNKEAKLNYVWMTCNDCSDEVVVTCVVCTK